MRKRALVLFCAALVAALFSLTPSAQAAGTPDGSFVRVIGSGQVFRIAGGAPIYVSSWSAFPGPRPAVTAVTAAQLRSLPQVPRDDSYLRAIQSGKVYKILSGAPVYVTSWASQGGRKPYVNVDQAAIEHAGDLGVWSHLWLHCADVFGNPGTEMIAYKIAQAGANCADARTLARYAMFHSNGRSFSYGTWKCVAVDVLPQGYPYSVNTCRSGGHGAKFFLNA